MFSSSFLSRTLSESYFLKIPDFLKCDFMALVSLVIDESSPISCSSSSSECSSVSAGSTASSYLSSFSTALLSASATSLFSRAFILASSLAATSAS